MSLSSFVQYVQKLHELIVGLATEHREQLLILSERYHFKRDNIPLFCAENLGLIKFTDKSGMFGIKIVHQEHVMFADNSRMIKSVIEIWTQEANFYIKYVDLTLITSINYLMNY